MGGPNTPKLKCITPYCSGSETGVKVAIRATGGIAGFVMIYLFDPGWIISILNVLK